jgi:hypothetical protein
MSSQEIKRTEATISLPGDFEFGQVLPVRIPDLPPAPPSPPPSLGPLAAFVGNWAGSGFNTIFRPDNPVTPTGPTLAFPVFGNDNILELNLTSESLAFSPSLGSVPNRGTNPQGDIFLNGVPYLQTVNDVTTGTKIGIHAEPGLWMIVQPTNAPAEGVTLARMASIPHGTTIDAQGTSTIIAGPPTIPSVNITPFFTATGVLNPFPSQNAASTDTPRIPQDLSGIAITQTMLDDPNSVLRAQISGQKIISTTEICISTNPALPLFAGGTDNIAFLQGNPAATAPNAQTVQLTATFWIETVQHRLIVPVFEPGDPPLQIKAGKELPGRPTPTFLVHPPFPITTPREIVFTTTQIQYSQTVLLNFNTLTWPHVSVATLIPAGTIPLPPIVWE